MQSLNIAHRGLHDQFPENSLEAFHAAWKAGCDMVEFDIQLTEDGVPVIFHDDSLNRMCGTDLELNVCSYSELTQFTLQGSGIEIPTLEQFMSIGSDRPHYFELKVPGSKSTDMQYKEKLVYECYRLLNEFSFLKESYVSSFDKDVLEIIQREGYYSDNLVVTFEFEHEVASYAASGKSYPYTSWCWDYLVKQNRGLVGDTERAFLWAIVDDDDYVDLRNDNYLGLISDRPLLFSDQAQNQ